MSRANTLGPAPWMLRLLLWPLKLAWGIVTRVVDLMGILLGLLVGFLLMAVGLLLCSGIITIFLGLPLLIIGFLLVLRALY
jgi:hypothetical protein